MKVITARKSWKDTAGNISTFNIAYVSQKPAQFDR
jgi:hypothetical protein